MRRGSVVQLVAIGVVCGAGAALVAILIPWLPDPASRQAGRIDFVFWFVTVISIAIFALVAAVIIYAIFKFRAGPDDDSDGPPIHGNTRLEIVWTAVPAALVTAISIVSAIVLAKNEHIPHASAANDPLKPVHVDVVAQQFAWTFKYPDFGGLTSATLKLPVNATTRLRITSLDVTHSFWVPQFGQKLDAVPGSFNALPDHARQAGQLPRDLHRALRARPRGHAFHRAGDAGRQVPLVGEEPAEAAGRHGGGLGQGRLHEQRLRRLPHARGRGRQGKGRARPR